MLGVCGGPSLFQLTHNIACHVTNNLMTRAQGGKLKQSFPWRVMMYLALQLLGALKPKTFGVCLDQFRVWSLVNEEEKAMFAN